MLTRRLLTALTATIALVAVASPVAPVDALKWTDGNTCSIVARSPVMVGTSVAGRFDINCTKLATVAIEISVGEWDPVRRGSITVNSLMIPTDSAVALVPTVMYYTPPTVNTTFTVASVYRTCWNSESDFEEYGTRVRIMTNFSPTTAGWSPYTTTKAPATLNANTHAC